MADERELLLLGLLRQGKMHGYQLHEFIETNLQTCVDLKKSTAYFLLDKMAEAGWVAFDETREGRRPARREYSITPAGEAMFQQLVRDNLGQYHEARFAGQVGVMFLDALPRAEAVALLGDRLAALEAALVAVEAAPEHAGSLQLVIDHQVAHLRAEIGWLRGVIAGRTAE